MSAPLEALERPWSGTVNTVFKSGPLFISSKGLGWKNWKKRWFILTRTSLVFFKNDPTALPQKGGDVNLTLGGIDLNNSGSVVVREDKKLLTVLFPDGRDGRAFTLKAETSEDLYEWKTALEEALDHAPNAALVMGRNGIFHSDANVAVEVSSAPLSDERPAKSLVVGQPILLALEDVDGGPSFLEKALRFLETYGNGVEGILRLCANVAEVERRIEEYEQGKNEFDPDEDAHVVGDCIKHVLRELPSSPVPEPCCTALLDAYRMEKEVQTNAMRSVVLEAFPEPNRRLLQRILKMMHIIASNPAENRMTSSSVATCMAPLLLRPLLAGDCEPGDNFATNADDSAQLLAAASAANSAAAIVTNLLEEYENIFCGCSLSPDSRIENSGSDGSTVAGDGIRKDKGCHDAVNEGGQDTDVDSDRVMSGKLSEASDYSSGIFMVLRSRVTSCALLTGNTHSLTLCAYLFGPQHSRVSALRVDECEDRADLDCASTANSKPVMNSPRLRRSTLESNGHGRVKRTTNMSENSTSVNDTPVTPASEPYRFMGEILSYMDPGFPLLASAAESCAPKTSRKLMGSGLGVKRSAFWSRSSARKTLSMESVGSSGEEELAIQKLESTKNDLRQRIAKAAKGNAILQASLEKRKQALHERRLSLEQDVQRLQEQLHAERELRAALEVGLSMSSGQLSNSHSMDYKTRAELEEIALAEADVSRLKQKVAELLHQLNQQRQHHFGSLYDVYDRRFQQQDFDSTLAFCNHERNQRYEEGHLGPDCRKMKGQAFSGGTPSRGGFPMDDFCDVGPPFNPSATRLDVMDFRRHGSPTLVELNSRLDLFKERRSQLMDQLQNLELDYGAAAHKGVVYRPASPSWS